MQPESRSLFRAPLAVFVGLLVLLLLLISVGWWQGTAVGPQVQVPMFYDAHYLFPRPWTQAQEAPGVPAPAPVALHGPNRITQSFTAAADRLAMVEIWLAGSRETAVFVSLSDGKSLIYRDEIPLVKGPAGGYYRLAFPPIAGSAGRPFRLTLTAPTATPQQPVTTHAIGGDRLGGAVRLNEYARPGNLELYTYSRGLPGRWWLQALGEQLLPALFRLRVQQYKPPAFKEAVFPALLVVTALLTLIFLVAARPSARPLGTAAGWWAAALVAAFLLWQVGSGRLRLPLLTQPVALESGTMPLALMPAPTDAPRLVNDQVLVLWTAERDPEARFVETDFVDGFPGVRVPPASRLGYGLTVPVNGRFRAGIAVESQGQLRFAVRFNGQPLAAQTVTAAGDTTWLDVDLSPLAGEAGSLELVTAPLDGVPTGLWLMPQLSAVPNWLLPDPLPASVALQPLAYRFDEQVELMGYEIDPTMLRAGETLAVTLYWRALQPAAARSTVFVHLLDEQGEIVAQHDAQPVQGTYPLPLWQPGVVVVDTHVLATTAALPAGEYRIAVGLYDPDTLARRPVVAEDGTPQSHGRILLPTLLSVE